MKKKARWSALRSSDAVVNGRSRSGQPSRRCIVRERILQPFTLKIVVTQSRPRGSAWGRRVVATEAAGSRGAVSPGGSFRRSREAQATNHGIGPARAAERVGVERGRDRRHPPGRKGRRGNRGPRAGAQDHKGEAPTAISVKKAVVGPRVGTGRSSTPCRRGSAPAGRGPAERNPTANSHGENGLKNNAAGPILDKSSSPNPSRGIVRESADDGEGGADQICSRGGVHSVHPGPHPDAELSHAGHRCLQNVP